MTKSHIRHLSAKEIIRLHDRTIQRFGGVPGIPVPDRVEAIIGRVINYSFYADIDDIPSLSAMYCVALARGHVFVDGNKRTAINSAILFGRRNGFFISPSPELDEIVVRIADGSMDLEELIRYFCRRQAE